MDTIEQAIANFERLGFKVTHHPYEPPANDPKEIERIKRELQTAKEQNYGKGEASSELELFFETEGVPESVTANEPLPAASCGVSR